MLRRLFHQVCLHIGLKRRGVSALTAQPFLRENYLQKNLATSHCWELVLSFSPPVCYLVWISPFFSSHFNLSHSIQPFFHAIQSFVWSRGERRRREKDIWELILSFHLAFCVTETREKRRDGEELERSLTAFFHSKDWKGGMIMIAGGSFTFFILR